MKIDFKGNLLDSKRTQYDDMSIYAHCLNCNHYFDSDLVQAQISKN